VAAVNRCEARVEWIREPGAHSARRLSSPTVPRYRNMKAAFVRSDQAYRLLRKNRIAANKGGTTAFHVPCGREAFFIFSGGR
jgi:hypothetical protein